MKLTRRLATLAFTAVALAGTLGAQHRGDDNHSAPRNPAPRGQTANRGRPDTHAQQAAAARPERRGRADARGYQENRGRADVRGHEGYRGPVDHDRPLITRAGYRGEHYGGGYYNNGFRYYRGINRFGVSIMLPFGWERPLYVRGYFPARYAEYCEAVPVDLEYMLPLMRDGYDPCLIGDRIVVYDRYSRGSIIFSAIIP